MIISVFGPNAIGKTTAARRWAAKYPGLLRCISADLCLVMENGEERREQGWNKTIEEKRALVGKYRQLSQVTIVETARTSRWVEPEDFVVALTCPWELHQKHMMARCAAKNKKFRAEYWTQAKLDYECSRRYTNFVAQYVHPSKYKHLAIADQARDWPKVDAFIYQLFRRFHNQLQ